MTDEAQSAAERAYEALGPRKPWDHFSTSDSREKRAYTDGYAAGAREQAGRVELSREEISLVLSSLPIERYAWQDESVTGAVQALEAKLRAALAAKEPAP